MKPVVAIIGRPNVGKSTFFNRLTRSRDALVDDRPGITRDRICRDAVWNQKKFMVVDTGGFWGDDEDPFANQIHEQLRLAIEEADVIIVLLDGKEGVSPFDHDLLKLVRPLSKPIYYVVNKIDDLQNESRLHDFYEFGLPDIYPMSAEHGYGMDDFLDTLTSSFPEESSDMPIEDDDKKPIRVAVVGRPNVGKSSLINQILGENRLLVSDVPGTTRDMVDTLFIRQNRTYLLMDTAGIRRKSKVSEKIEKFSVLKALKGLSECDVALIVLDAEQGVTEQDIRIAAYAVERGCGCILLLNKWDLMEKGERVQKEFISRFRFEEPHLSFAPILTISAVTGYHIANIFTLINRVYAQYTKRLSTGVLNRILLAATQKNEPSLFRGRRIKFLFASQVATQPPTFAVIVNYPLAIHFSYERYLINQIRLEGGFDLSPIRISFKERERRQLNFSAKNRKKVSKSKKK